jgi:ABC-type microcin C transport system permease subunit YejE
MTEFYLKYEMLARVIAFFVVWFVESALGYTAEAGKAAASFVAAIIFAAFILPALVSALDSFWMFFSSPIFQKRWKKFKTLKRGYYAFWIVVAIFFVSFFSEFLINSNAILVKYQGKVHFTLFSFQNARTFGLKSYGKPNYRLMKTIYQNRNKQRAERIAAGKATEEDKEYANWGDDWVLLPIYPYGPLESLLDELPCRPPHPPTWIESSWRKAFFDDQNYVFPEKMPTKDEIANKYGRPDWAELDQVHLYKNLALSGKLKLKPGVKRPATFQHLLGTDDRGRDVFARMVYGFRTSLAFALVVTFFCYIIGISFGAFLGYYGGKFDIIMQRFVEIWSAMPFLYTVMIFAAIMIPNFWMLVMILVLFKWMGMTYYIRGEFLREKSKDYVAAARAIGCTDGAIIFRHILPNALTPVISFAPFAVVANIGALVSLDFLGFGLPAPTPSWGELLGQGLANLTKPWLIMSPTVAMFITLLLVSFIGEAIREAFDPKQYSRLR